MKKTQKPQNPSPLNRFLLYFFVGFVSLLILGEFVKKERYNATYNEMVKFLKEDKIVGSLQIVDNSKIQGRINININELFKSSLQNLEKKEMREIGFEYQTNPTIDTEIFNLIKEKNIDIRYVKSKNYNWITSLIPMFIVLGILFFMMRKTGGGAGALNAVGKSKHKKYSSGELKTKLADVEGIDEAKAEVTEIIDFLKNPTKYHKLGANIPKGVLLVGPPGTGKTMLAQAIASEAEVPFYYTSGSEFIEMFVGVGASRIRDLFNDAKKDSPSIIFIDEIDTVGRKRGSDGFGGGHTEGEQTLNQLLVEMDGFEGYENVIVIAATNRADVLDDALLRPGRFSRQIMVQIPNYSGRLAILNVHINKSKVPIDKEKTSLETIARGTQGFSGAMLQNLINEAALHAARNNKNSVDQSDFEEARDKVLMGLKNSSLILNEKEKWNTAIHESGHTVINLVYKNLLDAIHKVSIIPRGFALGVTQTLPNEDGNVSFSKEKAEALIQMMMGGRVAEEVFFDNQKTTGASNDIEQATRIAVNMVKKYGMSENIGFLNLEKNPKSFAQEFSEKLNSDADKEIQNIIRENIQKTRNLIKKNKDLVEELATKLMEKETIDMQDINEVLKVIPIKC